MMITREKVEDVLLRMGMSVNLKGFGYIRDSVLMLDAEKDINISLLQNSKGVWYDSARSRASNPSCF